MISDSTVSSFSSQRPFVVAGPCSAESREQILTTAAALQPLGIDCFRAGIWKPRTRPGLFEGIGSEALPWLVEVQQTLHLRVGTEVCTPQHVEEVLRCGLDMVWIGARTTSSPFAVSELAQALKGTNIEVLVKNPISPDAALWCGAIGRLSSLGLRNLKAVFRGCTPLSPSALFRNFPYWRVVDRLRSELPHIPILCDPSHITGDRDRVMDLCLIAQELGMNGLMVECHPHPQEALSDAAQQVTPRQLHDILEALRSNGTSAADGIAVGLARYRALLSDIDQALFELLLQRVDLTARIARYKGEHNLPALQPEQYRIMTDKCTQMAQQEGLDSDFVLRLYELLHRESVRQQDQEIKYLRDQQDKI